MCGDAVALRVGVKQLEIQMVNLRMCRMVAVWGLALVVLAGGAAATTSQIPSCTVPPELADSQPLIAWVDVEVDSHGNMFAGDVSDVINWTPLEVYGVPVWARRQRAEGYWRVDYYTTTALEQKVCGVGRQIQFRDRSGLKGIQPRPYVVVKELRVSSPDPALQLFFLSSLGAEFDAILNGAIGGVWASSSNEFRLPRVADQIVPVHRFFGVLETGAAPSHFYTADEAEINALDRRIAAGARIFNEGAVFNAPRSSVQPDGTALCPSPDLVPVRRLYSSPKSLGAPAKYRYVTDASMALRLRASGWVDQGATFCALRD